MDSSCGPFALSKEDAERRYENYKNVDPFPSIEPALLSSAHIQAYIATTGMIHPFRLIKDKDKMITPASITMTVGTEVLSWDQKNNQQYRYDYSENDEIKLRPNSITFLRTAERFLIPDYIAIRFNLRIKHVHRGLLLGTGPLLDPGFKGYPMIPVHNLTENEYVIHVGEDFINAEFTKISDIYNETQKSIDDEKYSFKYDKNKGKTFDFPFMKYIIKNVPQRRVKSSLSSVIDEARELIEAQKRQLRLSYWGGLIGGTIALCALLYGGYALTIQALDIINSAREKIEINEIQRKEIKELSKKIRQLEEKISSNGKQTNPPITPAKNEEN